jgi:multiple sugar transport system ATP-binding protein
MAIVQFRNINKIFPDGFQAVRDLDLEIADGELVVLVGPSGCGKSTTLRMLAGLEEVTSGDILIGDRRVNDMAPGDRDIAMVFQNYALYPHMTVRKNLAFGLKMRRMPRAEIERRTLDVSEILGIGSLLDRRPRELSGGQRQRVALGRAIVRNPQVFLFDEPLSNLDAKLRLQMRTEIASLHQRLATTMLYVTHDQVEAMTLGDRIVIMREGEIQQQDEPLALYRRPANRFVAGFIGSPPMNFIDGTIDNGQFRFNGGQIELGQAPPNGQVCLGVRPEDLVVSAEGIPLATATIKVVEQMGHESMAHFDLAGRQLVIRLPADQHCQSGDQIELRIEPDRWHLFAADQAGKRLG